MNSPNPYAPPETRGEASPRTEQWYTEGTTLFVSDGAVLPAIDLETGEISEDLIEVSRKFALAGATLGLWGLVPTLFNLMPREWKRQLRPSSDDFWFLIAALLVLLATHIFVVFWRPRLFGKCVRFKTHRNAEAERKAKRTKIVTVVWYSLSLLCTLGALGVLLKRTPITDALPLMIGLVATGAVSMLACAAWQLFRLPKIRYKGFSGKWLRVHGACDEALAHLRMIEAERSNPITQ